MALAVAVAVTIGAGPATGAPATGASAPGTPTGALRLQGTFQMVGRVTRSTNVRGQRRGQALSRLWSLTAPCPGRQTCATATLTRQRSGGQTDVLGLHRIRGSDDFGGRGAFAVALRCHGRVYPRGGRAQERITVQVVKSVLVEQIAFATAITATYANPSRRNDTPCAGFIGRDGARYAGSLTSPVPTPPRARFSSSPSPPPTLNLSFADASTAGTGHAPILSTAWDFGDRASGQADFASTPAPSHAFSAPGTYSVTLTVTDANGLTDQYATPVTVGSQR